MRLLSFAFMNHFLIGTTAVSMFRVVFGPSTEDRLNGLNLVAAQVLAILVLTAVQHGLEVYLDVALVYDIFGFVGLLAIARYFSRREQGP